MKIRNAALAGIIAFAVSVTISYAQGIDDLVQHKNCKICGMNREQYGYARLLITYSEDRATGTCSIRCAALDLALNMGRVPESIMVGDYNSKRLMDAEKAHWVIGGKKEGVMSMRGKRAFRERSEAERFRAMNGGRMATFQDALKAAYEDLYKDLKIFWEGMKKQEAEK